MWRVSSQSTLLPKSGFRESYYYRESPARATVGERDFNTTLFPINRSPENQTDFKIPRSPNVVNRKGMMKLFLALSSKLFNFGECEEGRCQGKSAILAT